ncbi:MAG: adenosylcobinamide amidohydrolase [Acidimicrobiales bacterium]
MTIASYQSEATHRPVIIWRFDKPMHCLSSASVGGGFATIEWLINATVENDFALTDLDGFVASIAREHRLSGNGTGLLTAVDVNSVCWGREQGIEVCATVGVNRPTWAAAEPEQRIGPVAGTINIVAVFPVALSSAAAVNAVITITEAKSQVLADAGVKGTGTASDAVAVLWYDDPSPAAEFCGPRSLWGARLARATYSAVTNGLAERP